MYENVRYVYHILYHKTPEAAQGRKAHLQEHMERYKEFRAAYPGKLEFGGPLIDNEDDMNPIGSVGIIHLSKSQLEDFIKTDVFWARNIWDKKSLVVYPFLSLPQK